MQIAGNVPRAEAIAHYRKAFQFKLEQAQLALSVADEDLVVESANGVYRRQNIRLVTE